MSQKTAFILQLFLLFLIAGSFISCEDKTIDPYEDNEGVFSVYGALDVGKNWNVIRVRNLLEPFNASSFPIDATVTFTNLETGASTQLNDTLVYFSENKTHNYILKEDLELDTQYQLTVERSDGVRSISRVTTPGLTIADHQPDSIFVFCETLIEFTYANVHPPERVQMEVGVSYENDFYWAPMRIVGKIEYDPIRDLMYVKMRPRNLLVEVFPPPLPDDPYFDPYALRPTVSCDEIDNREITIRYIHFDKEWAEGQPIEYAPIDIESGVIENGLGFLGTYRQETFIVKYYPS